MKTGVLILMIVSIVCTAGCNRSEIDADIFTGSDFSKVIEQMTDVMIHDNTNPPLASRFFAYACLAAYEVVSQNNPAVPGLHGKLAGYPSLSRPDSITDYYYHLAALLAAIETAKKMQPSGSLLEKYKQALLDAVKKSGLSNDVAERSEKYAVEISKKILAYARSDGYNKISNLPRYAPSNEEGAWYPTPPAFMAAVEPYFNQVRPFTLDSCSQFKPLPPVAFSKSRNSDFYKMLTENYKIDLSQPEEQQQIASFWDCNPFAVQDNGHLMVGLKKISPGAHWLAITGISCSTAGKSFSQTVEIYTVVSIGLMDAFISCWDEKYRSNRIRPETAIRKYIDPNWKPLLQTPPFPEYPSGHSTISATCSEILTHYLGDNFAYADTVEVKYGLPSRKFKSFRQAAGEAAISRFYGGIHYMDAVVNGQDQGKRVGNHVLQKLKSK